MSASRSAEARSTPLLSERQAAVLRALVAAFLGQAQPIGSQTISHLLPVALSSASIRTVLGELDEAGLVEKPHRSAGRVPTERGLRLFVDVLLDPARIGDYEKRAIAYSVAEVAPDEVVKVTSQLLSERTHQLGFVVAPRVDRVTLRHVSLVRLSSERVLVVIVSAAGDAYQRVIDDIEGDQPELDTIGRLLNERVAGRTLNEVREHLRREAKALRDQANRLLARAVEIGTRALEVEVDAAVDVVIETRLSLLEQPEFRDPQRVRDLFAAVETKERLLVMLDRMLAAGGVHVLFGEEADDPHLRNCAVVATHYGEETAPLGMLGVIGPNRMDFGRVIPLVGYFSEVVTGKLAT